MITPSAIILAGGLGTRLRAVVPHLPKPMAPINGRPFLEYQLDYWIAQGVRHFILSVGYKRNIIIKHFGRQYREAQIEYAVEETPLGTGGALLLALQVLQPEQPFLVLNGDTFFGVQLQALQRYHAATRSEWTIAMFQSESFGRYGMIECTAEGRVEHFSSSKAKLGELANGGVYFISPAALSLLERCAATVISLEEHLLPNFLAQGGRCYGMPCYENFIDYGVPEDYIRITQMLR
ncbi:MAG: sugar phosphate nucleotidyltransferase [Pseudomonadota bacterium]